MSGYYAGASLPMPRCSHGRLAYERCVECEDRHERERVALARSIDDPAQALLDAYNAQRPWWDVCSFCRPGHAYTKLVHESSCLFVRTLEAARVRHGLYLVDVAEGRVSHPISTDRGGEAP